MKNGGRSFVKRNKGFTLIELVISLAIMGLLMATLAVVFVFVIRTSNSGNDRFAAQTGASQAMQRVQDELRFATSVTLLTKLPDTPDAAANYFSVDADGVFRQTAGSSTRFRMPADNADAYDYTLLAETASSRSLNVTVSVYKGAKLLFRLKTMVFLNSASISSGASGACIAYTAAPSSVPSVTGITIAPASGTSTTVSVGGTLQFKAAVYPVGAYQWVVWSVGDTSIATVNPSTGLVTGVKRGSSTTLKATAQDSSGIVSPSVTITVQ